MSRKRKTKTLAWRMRSGDMSLSAKSYAECARAGDPEAARLILALLLEEIKANEQFLGAENPIREFVLEALEDIVAYGEPEPGDANRAFGFVRSSGTPYTFPHFAGDVQASCAIFNCWLCSPSLARAVEAAKRVLGEGESRTVETLEKLVRDPMNPHFPKLKELTGSRVIFRFEEQRERGRSLESCMGDVIAELDHEIALRLSDRLGRPMRIQRKRIEECVSSAVTFWNLSPEFFDADRS